MISEGGSAAPRAMLFQAASPRLFNIELTTGRVRPSADKGLLDPPQAAFDLCRARRRNRNARMMKRAFGTRIYVIPTEVEESLTIVWSSQRFCAETVRDVSTSLDMTKTRGRFGAPPLRIRLTAAPGAGIEMRRG